MNAPLDEPPVPARAPGDEIPVRPNARGARLVWTVLAIILIIELVAMAWFSRSLFQQPKPKANPPAAPLTGNPAR